MDSELIERLPVAQRLALAYCPARSRDEVVACLAFEAELGAILSRTTEPIVAQMRLAWWRDNLSKPVNERPRGNPVLDALAGWEGDEEVLISLVNGWEELTAEKLSPSAIEEYAAARAGLWAAVALHIGCDDRVDDVRVAGRIWALGDLAARTTKESERRIVLECASGIPRTTASLPRELRPLAALSGLARRSLDRGGTALLSGAADLLAAIRLGLLGR